MTCTKFTFQKIFSDSVWPFVTPGTLFEQRWISWS